MTTRFNVFGETATFVTRKATKLGVLTRTAKNGVSTETAKDGVLYENSKDRVGTLTPATVSFENLLKH